MARSRTPLGKAREACGLSQADLAKKLHVTGTHVSRLENGWCLPSKKTAEALSHWLDLPLQKIRRLVLQTRKARAEMELDQASEDLKEAK